MDNRKSIAVQAVVSASETLIRVLGLAHEGLTDREFDWLLAMANNIHVEASTILRRRQSPPTISEGLDAVAAVIGKFDLEAFRDAMEARG